MSPHQADNIPEELKVIIGALEEFLRNFLHIISNLTNYKNNVKWISIFFSALHSPKIITKPLIYYNT